MSLPGPSGCRQHACATYAHHAPGFSSDTGPAGARNTIDPATSLSGGTPGKSFASGLRSAIVTYFVASTKRANCLLVTSVASIQNPPTSTWCGGWASENRGSSDPIQNRPPGTQTMPSGAGPGGATGF